MFFAVYALHNELDKKKCFKHFIIKIAHRTRVSIDASFIDVINKIIHIDRYKLLDKKIKNQYSSMGDRKGHFKSSRGQLARNAPSIRNYCTKANQW